MKTKEELNKLKEDVKTLDNEIYELSDQELEQVVGGAPIGYVDITSLDGIDTEDVPVGFVLDGITYTRAYMKTKAIDGIIYEFYVAQGSMVLIPQGK